MSTEQNKKMATAFAEFVNSRNLAEIDGLIDEIYASNYILHVVGTPDVSGREDMKHYTHSQIENTPDLHITILDVLGERDMVAMRFTVNATNTSTGKPETMEFIDICRFSGGKIVEEWTSGQTPPSV